MKDILVHYTHPEENKDTGLYTEVLNTKDISNSGTWARDIKWQ